MFRLVLVMVLLAVHMAGGVGDAAVVRGREDGMGNPYPGSGAAGGTISEGDLGIGRWCCFRWGC